MCSNEESQDFSSGENRQQQNDKQQMMLAKVAEDSLGTGDGSDFRRFELGALLRNLYYNNL